MKYKIFIFLTLKDENNSVGDDENNSVGDEPDSEGGSDRPPALPCQAAREEQRGLGEVHRLHHPQHELRHHHTRQEVRHGGVRGQGGLAAHHQVTALQQTRVTIIDKFVKN